MDRRDFMKRLLAGVAAVPFVGKLAETAQVETVAEVVEVPAAAVDPFFAVTSEDTRWMGTLTWMRDFDNFPRKYSGGIDWGITDSEKSITWVNGKPQVSTKD